MPLYIYFRVHATIKVFPWSENLLKVQPKKHTNCLLCLAKLRQLEIHNCALNRENELMRSYVKYFGGPTFQTSPEKALGWRTSNSGENVVVT